MKIKKYNYEFISPEEQYDFEQDFCFQTNQQLAKKYGCSVRTVIRKARELNLQKDELFRFQFDFRKFGAMGALHPNSIAARFIKGCHVSPATEFKPGHIPWIKGQPFSNLYMNVYLKTVPAH